MDNQCANIFSTYATVYGSQSVKFAYIERENIFLQVNPHFFEFGFVSFYLSPPPKFSLKLVYILVYAIFYVWTVENIPLKRYDG